MGRPRLRDRKGQRLPGRPGRGRNPVQRGGARGHLHGTHGGDIQPGRRGEARHAGLRRTEPGAHLLRRRLHRPGAPPRPPRADTAPRRPRVRGVVRPLAHHGRGRVRRRGRHGDEDGRHPRHPRQGGHHRGGRPRSRLRAEHQRPHLHRRRHGPCLPGGSAPHGHGDGAVPPHNPQVERRAPVGGRERRGRVPAELRGQSLHGALRPQHDGACLARRGLAGRADGDQRGQRRRRVRPTRRATSRREGHRREAQPDPAAWHRLRQRRHGARACPHSSRNALPDGRHQDRR